MGEPVLEARGNTECSVKVSAEREKKTLGIFGTVGAAVGLQTALWCLSLCALLGIRLKGISPALSGSDTSQGLRQRGTFQGKKLRFFLCQIVSRLNCTVKMI